MPSSFVCRLVLSSRVPHLEEEVNLNIVCKGRVPRDNDILVLEDDDNNLIVELEIITVIAIGTPRACDPEDSELQGGYIEDKRGNYIVQFNLILNSSDASKGSFCTFKAIRRR